MDSASFIIIALGIVAFAVLSGRLSATSLTPPLVFTAFGLMLGEAGFGLAPMGFEHGFVHTLAEVTLILVLFSDAARIDVGALKTDHTLPIRMLGLGLPLTVVAGTAAALILPLGLSVWDAALLAAILAPTDAALSQAVVTARAVPARIRQALNIESGLNDGISLPIVLFFACLADASHNLADRNWIQFIMLQITLGPLVGYGVGRIGGWLVERAVQAKWMEEAFQGPAILALAFLSYALAGQVGGNGFVAAFFAGMVFGRHLRGQCGFVFEFADSQGQLLTLLTFLLFGAAVLPEALTAVSVPMLLYVMLSLTIVRMVPVALSLWGTGVHAETRLFLGWFGPRGLASLLFGLFVVEDMASPFAHDILMITLLTVAGSILLHGMSAAPLARIYGAAMAAHKDGGRAEAEHREVTEFPLRLGRLSRRLMRGEDQGLT